MITRLQRHTLEERTDPVILGVIFLNIYQKGGGGVRDN